MRVTILACLWTLAATAAPSTQLQGLHDLVNRRIPSHYEDFVFVLKDDTPVSYSTSELVNDEFTISTPSNGSIVISGNTMSALACGLRRYFSAAHADIYWFIGSRLDEENVSLPKLNGTISGKSIVPWRYFFNTVTFSYTTPFWTWPDWELELDWLALHGVNLPLAWVGFEKILLDVFRDIGLKDPEIISFFSGPAFQAWNRFGNIQGSWGGDLPLEWIDSQFELQKKILERILELGMTPILPAFTGFVPRALSGRFPNATVVNGSRWNNFPDQYTNTSFLEPSDPLFFDLQERVLNKQLEYYGNITSFYTLDQYNENDPASGDLDYLRNVTRGTWESLKAANPSAVWVMQGWLFYSNRDFWTEERIEAYLSGVEEDEDMLVLDLFSESEPQWRRTKSYYGKPWIWNQLHDYGHNMGLYGQIDNLTINPTEALANSSSLVGFGLTPEGQEGNEIAYKLLLDQAWSSTPIDTAQYFQQWARTRYSSACETLPTALYTAWEYLRNSAYNNTDLSSNAASKGIYELAPNITRLTNRTGHHPTTINYNPDIVIQAWTQIYSAAQEEPSLWTHPAYQHDLVDITRQVLSNAFTITYTSLINVWNTSHPNTTTETQKEILQTHAQTLTSLLTTLDTVLSTLPQFSLHPWITSARALSNDTAHQDFYEFNARNQITQWGPNGEILDYASKAWGGLVGDYYLPRWEKFLGYLVGVTPEAYSHEEAREVVEPVEEMFQVVGSGLGMREETKSVKEVVEGIVVVVLEKLGVRVDG